MYDKNNIFAKIIKGEIPCKKVTETEFSLAFHDVNPKAKLHVLVLPKGEFTDIADFIAHASEIEKTDFWATVLSVAEELRVRDCFQAVANTGEGAGQSVPHFHLHIMSNK